ncbi:MAG: lipoprotein signal peptidase [Bacteroidales bacterium]
MKVSVGQKSLFIILGIILIDQIVKIWVKTHFQLHESVEVTSWFYILFTENNGMAMGMELFSKLFLSLFRIVAVFFIARYILKVIQQNFRFGYIICLSMILAGAAGNIFDGLFYGIIFDHSNGQIATLFPVGGGYAQFLYGKVVDMFYFPFFETNLPQWIPFVGGQDFVFFRYIFNVADASISVGVILVILFYRNELSHISEKPTVE